MAKLKVGDRVRVVSAMPDWFFVVGDTGVISANDGSDYRQFEVRLDNGKGTGWLAESEITPAVPDGWTPASEPPDNSRKVRVLTPDGLYDGLHLVVFGEYAWRLFSGNTIAAHFAAPGEVLAWREIDPGRKARYVVCLVPTEYTTLEDAEKHALQSVEGMRVNAVIARVVEEVKPGKPEIVRVEE